MAKLVSKVYGEALFKSAKSVDKLDSIYEEVKELKNIFENNKDIMKILSAPKIVKEEKIDAMKAIFSSEVSEELMGLLLVVIEKGRQDSFIEIFDYFIAEVKEYKSIGVVYVTSAFSLDEDKKTAIENKLLETTNYKEFEMNYIVDESIIGGLIIRIKDRVIDSSLSTKFYNIKKDLSKIQLA